MNEQKIAIQNFQTNSHPAHDLGHKQIIKVWNFFFFFFFFLWWVLSKMRLWKISHCVNYAVPVQYTLDLLASLHCTNEQKTRWRVCWHKIFVQGPHTIFLGVPKIWAHFIPDSSCKGGLKSGWLLAGSHKALSWYLEEQSETTPSVHYAYKIPCRRFLDPDVCKPDGRGIRKMIM